MQALYTTGILFLGSGLGVLYAGWDRHRERAELRADCHKERARRADVERRLADQHAANGVLAAEVGRLRLAVLAAGDLLDADAARRHAVAVPRPAAPEVPAADRIRLDAPVPVPGGE